LSKTKKDKKNSLRLKKQKMIIAATVLVFALLVGVIIFQSKKIQDSKSDSAAPMSCLETGLCDVGVSYSDGIPGFRVKNGKEYFGFDVDLANYMTAQLGRGAPVFVQADRDQSLTSPDKPVHMFISTVSMTDDRLKHMTFVGPYMRTFQGIAVARESLIQTSADLDHKTICAAESTTSSQALVDYKKVHPIDPRTEATTEQCIEKVAKGLYDAVTGDYITLQTHAHANKALRAVPNIRLSDGYELYGIALPKDSMALCERLKPLLKDFIREKWEAVFDSNLKDLGITYDPTNTSIPSLKPGENLVDIYSCKQQE